MTCASEQQSSCEFCSAVQCARDRNHLVPVPGSGITLLPPTGEATGVATEVMAVAGTALAATAGVMAAWTRADPVPRTARNTSSRVMRPPSPVPVTLLRSIPTSRAKRRTDGPAGTLSQASTTSWSTVCATATGCGAGCGVASFSEAGLGVKLVAMSERWTQLLGVRVAQLQGWTPEQVQA